ncbi:MAG: sulfurtransferase [Desulfobacteraceae bacterium]|nr:sulfurtransferase [Desulfobacteraceae bacterium]
MGGRSRVAAQMLAGKGFSRVYNLSGGIKAWEGKTAVGPQSLGMDLFDGSETPEDFLKVAFSLEQGLQTFYMDMADKAKTRPVQDLFEKLGAIEAKHQDAIFAAYTELADEPVSRDAFADMVQASAMEGGMTTEQYLASFDPDLSVETEVISLAMSIEAQALDLYQRVGDRVKNPQSQAIVQKIAADEKKHLARLGQLMDTL